MVATIKCDTIKEVSSATNNITLDSSGNVTVGNNLTVTGTTTQTGSTTFTGQTYFPNGSAAAPSIAHTGDTNCGFYFGTDTIYAATAGTNVLTLDSSGNLGLGATPGAWSSGRAIDINFAGYGMSAGYGFGLSFTTNAIYNGGFKYSLAAAALRYSQNNGGHEWFIAPSGSAGAAITFTQAMTLDAYGSLLVGTTTSPTTTSALGTISTPGTVLMGSSFLRNRIINGDMRIDQRNAGASVTPASTPNSYTLDRWQAVYSQNSKFSVQQNAGSVTPPAGFNYYLGVTSLSSYSLTATDYFDITQNIEGYNWSSFGFGSAGAKSVTFSFWVRSSLAGTFSATLTNSNDTQVYPFSYTISSSNTWEYKTITIPGSTTATWNTTNGVGAKIQFCLGLGSNYLGTLSNTWNAGTLYGPTGQVNIVSTNGATFYVTGVQLEEGSIATPFERRQYGQELALCQRYFYNRGGNQANEMANVGSFQAYSTTQTAGNLIFPVQMRAAPTLTVSANSDWGITTSTYSATACTAIAIAQVGILGCQIAGTVGSAVLTAGNATNMQALNSNARLNLSAEL